MAVDISAVELQLRNLSLYNLLYGIVTLMGIVLDIYNPTNYYFVPSFLSYNLAIVSCVIGVG